MKLTGNDIRSQQFPIRVRGYDRPEVDAFLFAAADCLDKLAANNEELALQCADLFEQYNRLKKERDEARKVLASLKELQDEAAARAGETERKAEADAARILADAEREAARLRAEAAESRALRDDLLVDLCGMLRSQAQLLETESRRAGVDLARLLGERSGAVINLSKKAEGDAS